jgi:hypothetical protein
VRSHDDEVGASSRNTELLRSPLAFRKERNDAYRVSPCDAPRDIIEVGLHLVQPFLVHIHQKLP